MEIKPLHDTPVEVLHQAFTDAFSDYEVPLDLPLERFLEMMRIRDLNIDYSLGCFDGDRLVSFIICGYRVLGGEGVCYDGGTGTIREYQKKGIGNSLLTEQISYLKDKGVGRFVLEVMENNRPAMDLYKKHGFSVTRRFECFKCQASELPEPDSQPFDTDTDMAHFLTLDTVPFITFHPSWQNTKLSVQNMPDRFRHVALKKGGDLMAYGVVHKERGDIPQLGILEPYRNQGVVKAILHELKNSTSSDKLVFLNVEENSYLARELRSIGFQNHVNQYEMQLIL